MEKFIEISLLYDFYGSLLNERQRSTIDYYYNNNYSLGEIGEKLSISRQGVHDLLKRAEDLLYEFEHKLQLLGKYKENQDLLRSAIEKIQNLKAKNTELQGDYKEIESNLKKVLKNL